MNHDGSTLRELEGTMLEDEPAAAPDASENRVVYGGTLVTNGAGIISFAADACASLLNTAPDFLIGKPLVAYMPREETHRFTRQLIAARRAAQSWATRLLPLFRPPCPAILTARPLPGRPGAAPTLEWRLYPTTSDGFVALSPLPPLEDQASSQTEMMRRAFLSAMTHELLTPLAIIQGHAETLRYPAVRDDQQQVDRALEAIRDETGRLRRLVQNVLDSARASVGELEIHPGPVSLEPTLTRTVQRFQARSRRHHFELHLPGDLPPVQADLERIESVLYNLLDNALKYSPRGGEICVCVRVRPGEVEISVEDEGVGVPPGEERQVFEPYYRAGQDTTRTQGSGLGLYLSKAVVDGHCGRIWIERRPEGGTAVRFTLPIA